MPIGMAKADLLLFRFRLYRPKLVNQRPAADPQFGGCVCTVAAAFVERRQNGRPLHL